MSPRTGRPKTDNPMNDRLYVRVTKEEKEEALEHAAEVRGNAKAGSLASKANRVREFNERNNK